uniref:Replication factor C subunit 1 n=1 Tax=Mucochytrium quahogii TaxID=96639 RepID=A0A7S2SF18_9STRA|mmetsp:Transcript_34650/g.55394  ORF Transcript_34650/g.55394 Transcript_34650/m.55394 type:complete len:757 (-) Transcript_34650:1134-3404(-)
MDIRGFFGKPKAATTTAGGGKRTSSGTEAAATTAKKQKVDAQPIDISSDNEVVDVTTVKRKIPLGAKAEGKKKRTNAPKQPSPVQTVDTDRFPLTNRKFVFTGVLRKYPDREDAVDAVKRFGANVTTCVSSKTTDVVGGYQATLEDERPVEQTRKYRDAVEKGINILDEEAFLKLLEECDRKRKSASPEKPMFEIGQEKAQAQAMPKLGDTGNSKEENPSMMLWVDKYKPKVVGDLIGNSSKINALKNWLAKWESIHIKGGPPPPFSKENPGSKVALLSGPPGIGKSSAAGIVSRAAGYDVMELNASDARSKKIISRVLGDALNCKSLSQSSEKRLVIMDEVDGMSSDDRGGMQELIKLMKKTKVPIICICNDRQKSSVRTLAGHCYDLKFIRPTSSVIVRKASIIAEKEGMRLEPNALNILVASAQNDVRQVLGTLQMWKRGSSKISYDDAKRQQKTVGKDSEFKMSDFEACQAIFNQASGKETLNERYGAFFINYDLMPLMVQQNYIGAANSAKGADEQEKLRRLSAAADAVCDSDLLQRRIRGDMSWGLLPQQAMANVHVGSICKGFIGFPGFPEWLGKNSSRGKKSRLLSETAAHMRMKTNMNTRTLRLDYLCLLRDHLVKPLLTGDKGNVIRTIDSMDSYGLDRDDVFETMQELQLSGPNMFDRIDSKTKAAFTREFNKKIHTSQALVHDDAIIGGGKGKKKKKKKTDDDDEEEEEEEEEDLETFIKNNQAKKKKAPAKKKTTAKGKQRKK